MRVKATVTFTQVFPKHVVVNGTKENLDNIGKLALSEAVHFAPKVTGRMAESLGYSIDTKTSMVKLHGDAPYTEFVEHGVGKRVMWELLGKTIPLMIDGRLQFRKATLKSFITVKIRKRDEKGRIMKGNKPLSWRYPGFKGRFFMRRGIQSAWEKARYAFVYKALREMMK